MSSSSTRDFVNNVTPPLTDDEIRNHIEIVSCNDKQCSNELRGRDTNALIIPAVLPPSLPSVNHNALPTYSPIQSMRTEVKPRKRTNVFLDMPFATS